MLITVTRAVGQALLLRRLVGRRHQAGLDVDTPATHLRVAAHRPEHDAAVEGAEVDHHVAVAQLRHLHHPVDDGRAAARREGPLFLRGCNGWQQQRTNQDGASAPQDFKAHVPSVVHLTASPVGWK
ncbi:MAG: hypothetical protein NTW37_03235 [Proteobacteria bacterium]|nr:hypothetical protein [Pseudomonadota bacterium]